MQKNKKEEGIKWYLNGEALGGYAGQSRHTVIMVGLGLNIQE